MDNKKSPMYGSLRVLHFLQGNLTYYFSISSLLNLLSPRAVFGAGVLTIPNAMSHTGLPLGILCFSSVALICLGTMLILLHCKKILLRRRHIEVNSYEELTEVVFGAWAGRAMEVILAFLTLIFCSGFLIVLTKNLHFVFPFIPRPAFCLVVFPILVGLSWIPYIKDLWMTSIFGLIVYLFGVIGTTIYYSSISDRNPEGVYDLKWSGVPHFFGVAVYALEGISLTLPVASSMKSRRWPPFVMATGVFGFGFITVFYSAYAYSRGYGTCDIITECLDPGPVVTTVRLALSLSLLATHPVYLIVASVIFEKTLTNIHPRYIRAGEVGFTCALAALVSDLGVFSSLVGSCMVTFIGFILPSLLWIKLISDDWPRWKRATTFITACLLILVGLWAMFIGTSEAIRNLLA